MTPRYPRTLRSHDMTPKRPHVCPICQGRGDVDGDFYTRIGYGTDTKRVACKACGGTGIVIA